MDTKCQIKRSPIVDFLKRNFQGATITIFFLDLPFFVTGEVVDSFDSVIGVKVGSTILFIRVEAISFFY